MPVRRRPPLPPLLPAGLQEEACIALLELHVGWTRTQARVVLCGVHGRTYAEIGELLQMTTSTVHSHLQGACQWIECTRRHKATALAVAVLWQAANQELSGKRPTRARARALPRTPRSLATARKQGELPAP